MKLRPLVLALAYSLAALSTGAFASTAASASASVPAATLSASASSPAPYLRYPALSGEHLVFTAEGDLWRSNLAGAPAQRLTTHHGEESHAAISADGKSLAFVASYDGAPEVYVMPLAGGLPKRISFEGSGSQVVGWSAQGEVLYSVQNPRGPNLQRVIVRVHPTSLQRSVLPVVDATDASLDESGENLYFTRMGLSLRQENVRRYRGGAAAQIWHYALNGKQEAKRLSPPHNFVDKRPMYWQGRIYFISDRGQGGKEHSDNLWSMLPDGSDAKQHTHLQDWDVRNASLNQGRIVFQLGADLALFDIASSKLQTLTTSLQSDFEQQRERILKRPQDYISHSSFAPAGDKLVITARGHILLAGLQALRKTEISLPHGSRALHAILAPDGKSVYAICDASGEQQIWRFATDGSSAQELTRGKHGQRTSLVISPDGKKLVHTTKTGQLWLLDLATGKEEMIDQSPEKDYGDIIWAPDNHTLAFAREGEKRALRQIWLLDTVSKKLQAVSSDKYQSESPNFSADGRWLFFLSQRHFQATHSHPWGDRHMGPFFDKRSKIYAHALQPQNRFPWQPHTELDDASADNSAGAAKSGAALAPIQWQGLAERVFEVPAAPANMRDLQSDGKRLYWLEYEASTPQRAQLKTLAMETGANSELFAPEVAEFALSQDRKKIMLHKASADGAGDFLILDAAAKAPADVSKAKVALADWPLQINPRAEWQQMFDDAWRMHRDYLFDPKLRGINWQAMHEKYRPLVARVNDKYELNDLLGMMMAELGTLHSQIAPGEVRKANDGVTPAFLGALLEKVANGYRIEHIYRTEAELPNERAPLAAPGLDIQIGDIISKINGKSVLEVDDISQLLKNQAGQQVLLQYHRKQQSRKAVITPVTLERNNALRYTDWEIARLEQVRQQSAGKIGYLHLRAMTPSDMNQFVREFYSHIEKDGLIIDVRKNNGGNIESWIIEKLLRRVWAFWQPRDGKIETNAQQSFRGHIAVLADEMTYSDGETFAAGIKKLGLGPVIGKRTAGAGVWLQDKNALVDKGRARVAENGQYDVVTGNWIIEGTGVAPDIEVENLPHASFEGEDAQLQTALDWLKRKLQAEPIKALQAQPLPPKNPD